MADDLYGELGVPADADVAAIRKAYRRRALDVHPDHGGSPAQFAVVKRAVDVLSDPERRRKYDATGDAAETTPDIEGSQILELISAVLDSTLGQMAQRGDIERAFQCNLVDLLSQQIGAIRGEIKGNISRLKEALKINERLLGRFKRVRKKKGEDGEQPNRMEAVIAGRVSAIRQQIAGLEGRYAIGKKALEFLAEYDFAADAKPAERPRTMGISMMDLLATTSRFGDVSLPIPSHEGYDVS